MNNTNTTANQQRVQILGIAIDILSKKEIYKKIIKTIEEHKRCEIIAINPKKIMLAQKDKILNKVVSEAEILIPDSAHLGKAIKHRITGIDLMDDICKNVKEAKIFLYGATEESVTKTKKNLEEKYKNLNIVGYKNGYTQGKEVIDEINVSKANILFVALGSPKQERWIYEFKKNLSVNVIMGVGGSFDVFSGKIKRAPKWIRHIGLEWLYRMIKEPKRFKDVPQYIKYMYLIKRERWKK